MEYTFYFVNNKRVIKEWRGCFENNDVAERFADGAAICAIHTSGEIGVFGICEDNRHILSRQMTDRRSNVLFAFIDNK